MDQGEEVPVEDLPLLQAVAEAEFEGLDGIDVAANYRLRGRMVDSGDSGFLIEWIFHGQHGTKHPGLADPETPADIEDQLQAGRTFLGYGETGQHVYIFAVTLFDKLRRPIATYWDRLSAIRQLGVRTTGRPVLDAVD
jgi:hypothetical protein